MKTMCLKCQGKRKIGNTSCPHCKGAGYIIVPKLDKKGHRKG